MLTALLLYAVVGTLDPPTPTPEPCVPVSQLRDLEAGTQATIDQLQRQLQTQAGVRDALRYLLQAAEKTAAPAPTAARAR